MKVVTMYESLDGRAYQTPEEARDHDRRYTVRTIAAEISDLLGGCPCTTGDARTDYAIHIADNRERVRAIFAEHETALAAAEDDV